jgi:hypothetical protein
MNSFSKSTSLKLRKFLLNGNTKFFQIALSIQFSFILFFILDCSSYLYTTDNKGENLSNLDKFTSCGDSIEYVSDTYRELDSTFPIQKIAAREYVFNKIPLIQEYFNKNMSVLRKDTTKISVEYQSDSRVIISYLYQVKDSITVIKDINTIILSSHSLDSALMSSVCVEVSVVKNNTATNVYIDDVNYSTVIGRSKANIMKAIMKVLPKMRYEYNRTLRLYGEVSGKLVLKFIINETGKIIYLKVIGSSLNNCVMENNEVNIVKECFFDTTDNKPNLTTVVYPFIFSQ